jgi:hypothetical protein
MFESIDINIIDMIIHTGIFLTIYCNLILLIYPYASYNIIHSTYFRNLELLYKFTNISPSQSTAFIDSLKDNIKTPSYWRVVKELYSKFGFIIIIVGLLWIIPLIYRLVYYTDKIPGSNYILILLSFGTILTEIYLYNLVFKSDVQFFDKGGCEKGLKAAESIRCECKNCEGKPFPEAEWCSPPTPTCNSGGKSGTPGCYSTNEHTCDCKAGLPSDLVQRRRVVDAVQKDAQRAQNIRTNEAPDKVVIDSQILKLFK